MHSGVVLIGFLFFYTITCASIQYLRSAHGDR
jgi:hypothetical protein